MDETMKSLEIAFRSFACTADGSALDMQSTWRGSTPGVEAVRVTLCGQDPLTGEPIPPQLHRVTFSRTKYSDHSRPLPLYGNYELRFEALGPGGTVLGSFRDPYPIRIENPSVRPRLAYRLERDKQWDRLTIESNCPRRWSGRLWVEQGGRLYRLSAGRGQGENAANFWFLREKGEVKLFSDDPDLPEPQRK